MSDSLPRQLYEQALARIVARLQLKEMHGQGGGPYLPLISHASMAKGPVGQVQVFRGGSICQLVSRQITPLVGAEAVAAMLGLLKQTRA